MSRLEKKSLPEGKKGLVYMAMMNPSVFLDELLHFVIRQSDVKSFLVDDSHSDFAVLFITVADKLSHLIFKEVAFEQLIN